MVAELELFGCLDHSTPLATHLADDGRKVNLVTCLVALQCGVYCHKHTSAAQTCTAVGHYGPLVSREEGKLSDEVVEFGGGWGAAEVGPKRVVEMVDLSLLWFTVLGQCQL